MKKYNMLIQSLKEEGCWPIREMFSKGHQSEKEFKLACKEAYKEECDENGEEIPIDFSFIEESKLYYKWGKMVGLFKEQERVGSSLSESKEYKKGYFPITKINL